MSCASVPQIGAPSDWIREGVLGGAGQQGRNNRLAPAETGGTACWRVFGSNGRTAAGRDEVETAATRFREAKRANREESAGGGRWLMA